MTDAAGGMVERVARAITANEPYRINGDYSLTGEQYIEKYWKLQLPAARASIAALRKPSDAMLQVVIQSTSSGGPLSKWQTMIDAALAEKPS